jgi:hypothetical protein
LRRSFRLTMSAMPDSPVCDCGHLARVRPAINGREGDCL